MSEIREDKKSAQACFDKVELNPESYRLGHTKVGDDRVYCIVKI